MGTITKEKAYVIGKHGTKKTFFGMLIQESYGNALKGRLCSSRQWGFQTSLLGARGMPRDSTEGLIVALVIPVDSKKGSTGALQQGPAGLPRGALIGALGILRVLRIAKREGLRP